jgi:hypothetical protein
MDLPDFTLDDLQALPLRAIVAFAARCGRRVEPLAQLPEGHAGSERRRATVAAALTLAEGFARGESVPPPGPVLDAIDTSQGIAGVARPCESAAAAAARAAHAAAAAIRALESAGDDPFQTPWWETDQMRATVARVEHVAAELVPLNAYTAAVEAASAAGSERSLPGVLDDYGTLLRLGLGRYPEPGKPIDPSPQGPLGPL